MKKKSNIDYGDPTISTYIPYEYDECIDNGNRDLEKPLLRNTPEDVNLDYIQKWRKHAMTPDEFEIMKEYEGLDYDVIDNDLHRRTIANLSLSERRFQTISQWFVFFLIGMSTGLVAFCISIAVKNVSHWRYHITLQIIRQNIWLSYIIYTTTGIIFVFIASSLVAYVEPVAAGSGIPQAKTYLNGVNTRRFLRLKTLIVKVIGVVFSVSGGLAIGKEGPLVHTGACFGANLSHLPKCNIKRFRNDRFKRAFVSGGCASGVSSAFGSPVGGVLFSFEEASTFWSTSLTWRVFFCAMVSSFTLNICLSSYRGSLLNVNSPGLITFGRFVENAYKLWELIPFAMLAIFGGLLGALFNKINYSICKWRRNSLELKQRRMGRVLEACIVAFVTATLSFWIPALFNNDCRPQPHHPYDETLYKPYLCAPDEYNEMANIIFSTSEDAIKSFFHTTVQYSFKALALHFLTYYCLAVWTYGISVPSGLFVPCILIGCSLGRMMGEFIEHLIPHSGIDAGIYALVGATAVLGGVTRMTVSLTVILLETTNDIQYLLPIMMVLMISKWAGDLFNISLYDKHVELKCVPFVEAIPPPDLDLSLASSIMDVNVIFFREVERVGFVYDTLESNLHNGFPVVKLQDSNEEETRRKYLGIILRRQLIILMMKRVFLSSDYQLNQVDGTDIIRDYGLKERDFSTTLSSLVPPLSNLHLSDAERKMWIDMRPFYNPGAFSVSCKAPVPRIYRLFRGMGLRHLPGWVII